MDMPAAARAKKPRASTKLVVKDGGCLKLAG